VSQQFETTEKIMMDNLSEQQVQILEEKRFNAEQNLLSLEDALKNHIAREQEFLRPLLGTVLKEGISKETDEIFKQFTETNSAIRNTHFEESNREQALVKIVNIKLPLENMSLMVEAHTAKLDSVLKLLESILGLRRS
jgi:hypothetical protein